VYCAVVLGASIPGSVVRLFGTGPIQSTRATTAVFVLSVPPPGLDCPLPFYSLALCASNFFAVFNICLLTAEAQRRRESFCLVLWFCLSIPVLRLCASQSGRAAQRAGWFGGRASAEHVNAEHCHETSRHTQSPPREGCPQGGVGQISAQHKLWTLKAPLQTHPCPSQEGIALAISSKLSLLSDFPGSQPDRQRTQSINLTR
jgi:hypothetical protein